MKTPSFWYEYRGFFSTLLWPVGWLYGKLGKTISRFKKPQHFPVPIISIGNIVCGGAGKTPTAIALMSILEKRGYRVHFVTRGYGGRERGPLRVDPANHKSCEVGDEPLLLAQHAPTWVAKKRSCGVEKAIEQGAQLIILDDGHQTTTLYKDVSLVVIDALQGFGNGRVIPAGPLREELSEGIKRADGFIEIGESSVQCSVFNIQKESLGAPSFKAKIVPQPLTFTSNRVVAFCGLGFPQKFYMSLKELGIDLIATETFPDHYEYKTEDLIRLQKLAQKHNSVLVTTRKDFVKIPLPWQEQLHILDITIVFENSEKICDFILQKVCPFGRTT
ncbi:MAG: tetraacyldisaccharide 4'-kinase [Alphaproteobacteria bacterium]|nr:tetraacyldisaccharide 4'-kinase [Alphaproteobacteria bacterium]